MYYEDIKKQENFNDLSETIQKDLIEWFNCSEPSETDKKELLELYNSNCFSAWDCPECNTRVFRGEPDNYDNFQGVLNQNFSFFGNPEKYTQDYIEQCCDSCRFDM